MKAWLLIHPIVAAVLTGALSGWASAAVTDYDAFRSWDTWHNVATYDWRTASFRWFKGAVSGALMASPIGYLVS